MHSSWILLRVGNQQTEPAPPTETDRPGTVHLPFFRVDAQSLSLERTHASSNHLHRRHTGSRYASSARPVESSAILLYAAYRILFFPVIRTPVSCIRDDDYTAIPLSHPVINPLPRAHYSPSASCRTASHRLYIHPSVRPSVHLHPSHRVAGRFPPIIGHINLILPPFHLSPGTVATAATVVISVAVLRHTTPPRHHAEAFIV